MRTIDMMLSNEKYIGDIVLFKTITVNYPYSVRRSNKGAALHEQFCMTNGVDAVISKETFEAVQSEKKRRSNIVIDESGNKHAVRTVNDNAGGRINGQAGNILKQLIPFLFA